MPSSSSGPRLASRRDNESSETTRLPPQASGTAREMIEWLVAKPPIWSLRSCVQRMRLAELSPGRSVSTAIN